MKLTKEQEERFWSKVNLPLLNLSGECWEWAAALNKYGYGQFKLNNKTVHSHRLMYELFNGDIPKTMHILHSCDNPKCMNPYHLSVGTHIANMQDKVSKNRQFSKLTKAQVLEIKELYQTGNYTQNQLGDMFQVCQPQISKLVTNKYWKRA